MQGGGSGDTTSAFCSSFSDRKWALQSGGRGNKCPYFSRYLGSNSSFSHCHLFCYLLSPVSDSRRESCSCFPAVMWAASLPSASAQSEPKEWKALCVYTLTMSQKILSCLPALSWGKWRRGIQITSHMLQGKADWFPEAGNGKPCRKGR